MQRVDVQKELSDVEAQISALQNRAEKLRRISRKPTPEQIADLHKRFRQTVGSCAHR